MHVGFLFVFLVCAVLCNSEKLSAYMYCYILKLFDYFSHHWLLYIILLLSRALFTFVTAQRDKGGNDDINVTYFVAGLGETKSGEPVRLLSFPFFSSFSIAIYVDKSLNFWPFSTCKEFSTCNGRKLKENELFFKAVIEWQHSLNSIDIF